MTTDAYIPSHLIIESSKAGLSSETDLGPIDFHIDFPKDPSGLLTFFCTSRTTLHLPLFLKLARTGTYFLAIIGNPILHGKRKTGFRFDSTSNRMLEVSCHRDGEEEAVQFAFETLSNATFYHYHSTDAKTGAPTETKFEWAAPLRRG